MIRSKFPYNIVLEPKREERSDRYLDEHEDIYYHIQERDKPNLKKVERFFQRWKQYPEVWNLYYGALVKSNQNSESEKFLVQFSEAFPDYLFVKFNQAKKLIFSDRFEEAISYLGGESPDLQRWFADNDEIWIEHLLLYFSLFIDLEIQRKDFDKASKYIVHVEDSFYLEENPTDDVSESIHNAFLRYNQEIMLHRLSKMHDFLYNGEPEYVKPIPPANYSHKSFVHNEIEALFELKTLEEKEIKTILSLPRKTAIADLNLILYLTMFEFSEDDYNMNQYFAVSHAVWFLTEFKAIEDDTMARLLLQMDSEFLDFWYGDFWIENSWFYFYSFLKENKTGLIDVFYLPNKNAYIKSSLLEAMQQLALHHPDKRNQVINWLSDLLQFYIDNQHAEDILDTTFTGFIEGTVLDINAEELIPKLKILHESQLIDEFVSGDFIDVEEHFKNPESADQHKLPLKSIYELAKEEIIWFEENEDSYIEKKIDENNSKYSLTVKEEKKYPKTGRNEPCPCGSGKKYKKCCGV